MKYFMDKHVCGRFQQVVSKKLTSSSITLNIEPQAKPIKNCQI